MTKAVALLSGGLDSTLAVKLMIDQGIEVYALNFTSAFCTCDSGARKESGCKSESRRVAEEFGIPIKVLLKGDDYIDVVRDPKHGYGKGINPCVDCRVYIFVRAKEYMEEIGASFIITGEVLGQRPMSQRRETMGIIERESGLEGLIVRPLCALQMEPTIPEKNGLIDREKMLTIVGRGRRQQMDLADDLDINDYPCPSGGCLLTDKIFSKKVRDLLDHNEEVDKKDLLMLRIGRHFRHNGSKVIVGRDEAENERLLKIASDTHMVVEPVDFPGPVAVVTEGTGNGAREFAGGLVVRYSAKAGERGRLKATLEGESVEFEADGIVEKGVVEEANLC
jgi:tRNA U34 2-thiouridine synthase MnmA/TrmU